MKTYNLSTHARDCFVDITSNVRTAVRESGLTKGACVVYCPHTTAGITINENADPNVSRDILFALDRSFPWKQGYQHSEGNAAAHIKASVIGSYVYIIVEDTQPVLGTWQAIFFCEFDGPRTREFYVQVIPK